MFQGTIIRNEPAFRPRPAVISGYHKFSQGAYDAFVAISALEQIALETRRTAPNETIGHLIGRPFRDAKGPYAIVTDAVLANSARRGPVTVETSLDDERGLLDTLLTKHPTTEKLGWFHSHPFPMPSYSNTDAENQRFWSEPYHLGLLANLEEAPSAVSIHAFRGPDSERLQPAYNTGDQSFNGSFIPSSAFRPLFRPAVAQHAGQRPDRHPWRPRRWSRLVMVAIVIGIVSPIVCLTGTWMIVRAMVEGQMHVTNAEGKGMQDAESFFEQREEMSRPDNSPKELGKQPRALDEEAKKKVPPPPTAGKSVSNPPQSHPESIESKKAVAPAQRQSSSH